MPKHGWTEEELYLVRERAHSLYLQGKHAEAGALLEGTVALDPEDRYSRYALAAVCLTLGRPLEARVHLDILVAHDSGDVEARALRCEALIDSGEVGEAAAEVQELRNILPSSQAALLAMRWNAAAAGGGLQPARGFSPATHDQK
jgi:predicted Zn-dependent protease